MTKERCLQIIKQELIRQSDTTRFKLYMTLGDVLDYRFDLDALAEAIINSVNSDLHKIPIQTESAPEALSELRMNPRQ
jgi:hypothetical protein